MSFVTLHATRTAAWLQHASPMEETRERLATLAMIIRDIFAPVWELMRVVEGRWCVLPSDFSREARCAAMRRHRENCRPDRPLTPSCSIQTAALLVLFS